MLGINEIASAVGVRLHEAGFAVLMSHDPNPPVIRRGMAFFDALYDDTVSIEGVSAVCVEDTTAARALLSHKNSVGVTRLPINELITIGEIDVLIDARMQKHATTPDLRHLASITVGLGPGFTVGENCDVAIETKPGQEGHTLERGQTLAADGVSRMLGGLGRERFVYSVCAGRWRTALDVGARIFKGFPLGVLGSSVVTSPLDGILRGIARDDVDVPANVKLVEIDPRGRKAQWTGIDSRGSTIAEATTCAIVALRRVRARAAAH
jgi:hypothetical protein